MIESLFIPTPWKKCLICVKKGVKFTYRTFSLEPPPPFLYILWKWNNLVSVRMKQFDLTNLVLVRPNYFIFIGYLRKGKWTPTHFYIWTPFPEIVDPPLNSQMRYTSQTQAELDERRTIRKHLFCVWVWGGGIYYNMSVWATTWDFQPCGIWQL